MSSVRAFLAIPLSHALIKNLGEIQARLEAEVNNIRWCQPQNLHLTLHFFGDTTQESLEKIKVSMLSVRRGIKPFTAEIRRLGGFPNVRRCKVIWVGVNKQAQLKNLHREIQQSLHNFGLPMDTRSYTPHLTIGRVRGNTVDITEHSVTLTDTSLGHLYIDRMVLYESRLQPGGAEHIPLFTVNFDEETDSLS